MVFRRMFESDYIVLTKVCLSDIPSRGISCHNTVQETSYYAKVRTKFLTIMALQFVRIQVQRWRKSIEVQLLFN